MCIRDSPGAARRPPQTTSGGGGPPLPPPRVGPGPRPTQQGSRDNKTKNKWTNRFSKRRLKCASDNDTKMLSVFDICSSIAKGVNSPNCDYKTNDPHFMQSTGDGVMIIGKMQVNMNNQRVKKVLYFQID